MKSAQELMTEKTTLLAEQASAQRELQEIETKGATGAKALADHAKARSRADILERRTREIEVEIRAARRAELQAKIETLQAAYLAACKKREEVQAALTAKFEGLYSYPGGLAILRIAVSGAQPLREQIFAAMALDEELRRSRAILYDMK